MRRNWNLSVVVLALFGVIVGGVSVRAQSAADQQAVPRLVPFGGQLQSATGEARTGTLQLTFGLYGDQAGGDALWSEQHVVTTDASGRYAVVLGSSTGDGIPAGPFVNNAARWIGVQVEAEPELPRIMLLSLPYALKAGDANTLAGRTSADFVLQETLTDAVRSTLESEGVKTGQAGQGDIGIQVSSAGKIAKFSDTVNSTVDSVITESIGKIGIGNASPSVTLDVNGSQAIRGQMFMGDGSSSDFRKLTANTPLNFRNSGGVPEMTIDGVGNVSVNGNIAAKYQDVAEWVETGAPLEAGTVVIVNPLEFDRVVPSPRAYDTRVAGAVSRQPGLILGERGDSKSLIAQSGRVRIKVDATYGAIKPGDLLVTSPTPGHAMRSKPIKVGGQSLHRPGTLVGKALEALPSGKGEILVLLTLQ